MQAQLFCTKLSYCDFIVWTKNDLHVERIKPNTTFMENNLAIVKHFFEVAVLPELLGRWFSRPMESVSVNESASLPSSAESQSSPSTSSGANHSEVVLHTSPTEHKTDQYCYCQKGEHGRMVGCDNNSCIYRWFHLECLKLKNFPKSSKWYCPDCRKLNSRKSQSQVLS